MASEEDILFVPSSLPATAPASAPPEEEDIVFQPSSKTLGGDAHIYETLKQQGFTTGMVDALLKNKKSFPLRIWVVDNSGSMRAADGQRIADTSTNSSVTLEKCTRWAEIVETVQYHARMSGLMEAATIFRLLNHPGADVGPQQFSIANGDGDENGDDMTIDQEVDRAIRIMKGASPDEYTPLNHHVREIINHVRGMEGELRKNGQKVAIIIATDGVPSDGDKTSFVHYLKELGSLPIWLVFRLCTNEDQVVDFYGDLDKLLEKPVDVLDDFVSEAKEVYKVNRWINYSLSLHRMRELGFKHRLFDLIDERLLTKDEIYEYCTFIYGEEKMSKAPYPTSDWEGFLSYMGVVTEGGEPKSWSPASKTVQPLVCVDTLRKVFGGNFNSGYGKGPSPQPVRRTGGYNGPPPAQDGCCIIT